MLNSFLMQRSLLFLTLAVLRGEKWVLQVLLLALMAVMRRSCSQV